MYHGFPPHVRHLQAIVFYAMVEKQTTAKHEGNLVIVLYFVAVILSLRYK